MVYATELGVHSRANTGDLSIPIDLGDYDLGHWTEKTGREL